MSNWFTPGKALGGWYHKDRAHLRRYRALKSRNGDPLKAGRALLALANVTRDKQTKEAAKADATYFFKLNSKQKQK